MVVVPGVPAERFVSQQSSPLLNHPINSGWIPCFQAVGQRFESSMGRQQRQGFSSSSDSPASRWFSQVPVSAADSAAAESVRKRC